MNKKQQIAALVGLFIALGMPFVLDLLLGKRPEDLAIPSCAILFVVEEWVLALVLLGVVLFWEKQSLASIGIKRVT